VRTGGGPVRTRAADDWIGADCAPTYSGCYHDAIVALPDDACRTTCPRFGEIALITPMEGEWS